MSKIQDYDLSKQDINVQDTHEEIRNILNNGQYEMKKITSSYPNWSEGKDGVMVLSVFSASRRLYISDMSATSKWSYVALTELT